MGYSKSLNAIERVKKHLDQMVRATGKVTWTVREDAWQLGYYIREALYVAEIKRVKEYAELKAKFKIRVDGNKVIAEPRSFTAVQSLDTIQLENITDTLEIIGAALHHDAQRMHFPNAQEINLKHLYDWCSKHGYNIIPSSAGVTITKEDVGDIAWKPESSS